jgi:chromosomal replication initiation ATPase DnaA
MINLTPHNILVIDMILDHYGEDRSCLKDKSRIQKKVFARQLVMMYLREQRHTLSAIGEFFDKDHSTVIHGIKSAEQLVIATDGTRSLWNRININWDLCASY